MKWSLIEDSNGDGPEVKDIDAMKDVVVFVSFQISDTQDGFVGSVQYSKNLLPPDPQNFKPYKDVTQTDAVAWIRAALGTQTIMRIEAEVQKQIDDQKNAAKPDQPKRKPWPWNPKAIAS